MRGPRSTSPCPTKQQVEKLKLLQTAIKKRTTKPDFMTNYKIHIIISIVIGFLIISYLSFTKQTKEYIIINESEIKSHNSQGHSYNLGPNAFFYNITLMQAKTLFKNDFTQQINVEKCKLSFIEEIPVYYNFKEFYPQCNHQVYNQGNCSSSYSIAVSSSFSDRVCKQNQTQQLSAQNLLSCDGKLNLGCKGGHLTRSADYIIKHGLTTNECHPFRGDDTFKECTNALDHCQRFKAESYCQLQNKDDIKRDILMKGPAVAIMPVYKDFLIYKDGIYQVLDGQPHFHGGQAVKIIGWGEHNGQQYWIIENTWGDTWGINGLAKISIDSFSEMSQQALSLNI
ncbi:unnamed protein product (macronuclear) [Paramecium tetraurelia]|uniref:Peptidase C1A papain C-terminal domain-containing protein n=1 Tax=Paramecium tetraurelia TaxID=5888 RepID=A0CE34_PARTE|nr:uncharacterized protein GSPATT00007263001 [Paramecium tetraurelia]CAK69051.1 unnamed protein product [Paramecium tetraurelia]|eukprot:XP_001436448.1 hypothetical protein (macronuclear) [Paramecium tetraurelia strain d4-2]